MTTVQERNAKAAREAWQIMTELVTDLGRQRAVSEHVGLSFGKLRALRRIAAHPSTMGEISALLGIDPPNLTAIVDGLEDLGLVERQPHPVDRRARLVVATKTGAALARKAQQFMARPPKELVQLPTSDLEELERILLSVRAVSSEQPT